MNPLDLTGSRPLLIGVVHLAPTPGAPRFEGSVEALLERAETDARALAEGGADALLVENFGDAPFFAERVPPETVAALTLAVERVRRAATRGSRTLPFGINVLRNDARAALGIAAATGASFVRINVHVGAAVTDQGLIQGRAAETLRERARLSPDVRLLVDVGVKHASPLAERPLEDEAADAAQRGLADALIVTGAATGRPPSPERVRRVRAASGVPVLVGSGLSDQNAATLVGEAGAGGGIAGTWLKREGRVEQPVDVDRVARLRAAFDAVGPRRPEDPDRPDGGR